MASAVEMSAGGVSSGLTVTSLAVPRTSAQAGSAGVDRQLGQVLSAVSLRQNNAADLQNGQNDRFLRREDSQLYGRVSNGMNNEPVQMLQSTNSGQQANELVRTSSASQTYEPRNVQMQGTVHSPPPTNEFLPGTYSTPIEQERAQGDVHYAQRIGRQANDPHSSGNDPDAIGMTARQHSGLVVRAASNHVENSNRFSLPHIQQDYFPKTTQESFSGMEILHRRMFQYLVVREIVTHSPCLNKHNLVVIQLQEDLIFSLVIKSTIILHTP